MNDDLDKIKECLTRIESLCTSPHWDSGRKNQIVELTSLAQAYVANARRQFPLPKSDIQIQQMGIRQRDR